MNIGCYQHLSHTMFVGCYHTYIGCMLWYTYHNIHPTQRTSLWCTLRINHNIHDIIWQRTLCITSQYTCDVIHICMLCVSHYVLCVMWYTHITHNMLCVSYDMIGYIISYLISYDRCIMIYHIQTWYDICAWICIDQTHTSDACAYRTAWHATDPLTMNVLMKWWRFTKIVVINRSK